MLPPVKSIAAAANKTKNDADAPDAVLLRTARHWPRVLKVPCICGGEYRFTCLLPPRRRPALLSSRTLRECERESDSFLRGSEGGHEKVGRRAEVKDEAARQKHNNRQTDRQTDKNEGENDRIYDDTKRGGGEGAGESGRVQKMPAGFRYQVFRAQASVWYQDQNIFRILACAAVSLKITNAPERILSLPSPRVSGRLKHTPRTYRGSGP